MLNGQKSRRTAAPSRPQTLGDLIAEVHDRADRAARGRRDRRRLAAVWVAVTLLGSGNGRALRRLAGAV